ncbi:hypothetical protein DXG01_003372 [Tephrocybe rancida]|nr:hypothetical protein DXG01_003372 [Tephrocybe rancida]
MFSMLNVLRVLRAQDPGIPLISLVMTLRKHFCSLVTLSTSIASAAAAQTTGSFSLLSYNVAGLPEGISSGNPEVNTPLISPRLKPYNIINVQEDFNYHAALYASDTHAFRTPTSGGAAIGSGLNTLSDFPYIDLDRVKWNDCNLNSGDCLTPKGFTFMRVRVSDGLWLDLYNLHADAGDDDGDLTARQSNLAQVSSYVKTWSVGMPVVIMGDTNTRYTREVDSESLHSLVDTNGLTDAWVSAIRGGSYPAAGADALVCDFPFAAGTTQAQMVACEVVDKTFIRSSSTVSFKSITFTNEDNAFVDAAGAPLSDHYPTSSKLSWTLSSSIRLADPVGGPHGNAFNDAPAVLSTAILPKITSLIIRSGDRVDAVSYTAQYTNGTSTALSHGGTGGTVTTLALGMGERVIQVQTCSGTFSDTTRVFYISFVTNLGRTLKGGVITSDCANSTVPTDVGASGKQWGLASFWGRSGDEVDRIGAIWGAAY